jgi:Transposase DDE domain group 1
MITRNLHRLKVEKTNQRLTSFAGIPLLNELAHQIGLIEDLNRIRGLWKRHKEYDTADYVMSLALTLAAGGEGLDDVRQLRTDEGVRALGMEDIPASNSLGEFLRRFGHYTIHRLAGVNSLQAARAIEREGLRSVTLDIDSTLIESDKQEAAKTYKGFEGYNPLLAWLAEPNLFLAGVFRPGNASPASHNLSLLKHCHRLLPEEIGLRFRSDSAGYQKEVMRYCVEQRIEFTITADLDSSVMETIEKIPEEKWQLIVNDKESFLLAETVHAPGGCDSVQRLPAFRLIVTKKLNGQLALFKNPIDYRAVITNREGLSALELLNFHNGRGKAEKAIGELKNGFGLDRLPCGQLMANSAFMQICMLAYNLVQIFKQAGLPSGWRKFCIKSLRFRLLCQAAIVVAHAGRLVLKLSNSFHFFKIFENARWAMISPTLVT